VSYRWRTHLLENGQDLQELIQLKSGKVSNGQQGRDLALHLCPKRFPEPLEPWSANSEQALLAMNKSSGGSLVCGKCGAGARVRVMERTAVNFREIGAGVDVDRVVLVPEAHAVHGKEEKGEAVQEVGEAHRQAVL
jgi:hypothetical protein